MGTHFYKNTNTRGTALQFPIFQYLTHSLSMVRRPFVRWPRSDWDVSYKWNSVYDINLGVLLMKRRFCPKLCPFFLSFVCPLVRSFRFLSARLFVTYNHLMIRCCFSLLVKKIGAPKLAYLHPVWLEIWIWYILRPCSLFLIVWSFVRSFSHLFCCFSFCLSFRLFVTLPPEQSGEPG